MFPDFIAVFERLINIFNLACMTTPQVSFNRRKVEALNYYCHTPLSTNSNPSRMKEIRNHIGQQVAKIDPQFLFTLVQSKNLKEKRATNQRDIPDP